VPATAQVATPEMLMVPQVPFWFPPVLLHWPEQQSLFWKQVSLVWRQYDAVAEQVPPTQASEQQSVFDPHGSPEPRHVVVSALHLPPEQSPLQHWMLLVHEAAVGVSGRHAVAWQVLFEPQLPEQQSEPVKHAWPFV
jgi:hypothetical protein